MLNQTLIWLGCCGDEDSTYHSRPFQSSPSHANSSLRSKSLALRCTKKGFPRRYIYISKARSFPVGLKIPYPYIAYFCVLKSFLRLTVREKMKYGMREMVKEQISCWRIWLEESCSQGIKIITSFPFEDHIIVLLVLSLL